MVRRCAHRIWGLTGAPADSARHSLRLKDRFSLTHRLFFFGPELGHINIHSPHNAQFLNTHRSVRLHNSLTCMGNRTDFCTSDHHLGITHGRKTVSPSSNPCDSDPFLVAIHNRCSPSDQHRSSFLGPELDGSASMGTDLLFAFLSTAEHRLTRAILERHHARATSELSGRRSSTSLFLCLFGFTWFVLFFFFFLFLSSHL